MSNSIQLPMPPCIKYFAVRCVGQQRKEKSRSFSSFARAGRFEDSTATQETVPLCALSPIASAVISHVFFEIILSDIDILFFFIPRRIFIT